MMQQLSITSARLGRTAQQRSLLVAIRFTGRLFSIFQFHFTGFYLVVKLSTYSSALAHNLEASEYRRESHNHHIFTIVYLPNFP